MSENAIPLSEWANDDKPREKLSLKGPQSLSDAELIAILLGTGTPQDSALMVSRKILSRAENSLSILGTLNLQQLLLFKGVGQTKAVRVLAALELGRRRALAEIPKRISLSTSSVGYQLMQPLIADLPHEEFWVLHLNNSNQILHKQQVSKGGLTGTFVDLRIIFKTTLEYSAVALVLCHNHPSGKLKPSEADLQITRRIVSAAQALDIRVLDHLIISSYGYLSFADEGFM
jgi:DNA repair protein RadC